MASAQLFLNGARVDREFREALFDRANRWGVSPLEFCLRAAAEKMATQGTSVPGVFRRGDLEAVPGFYRPAVGKNAPQRPEAA